MCVRKKLIGNWYVLVFNFCRIYGIWTVPKNKAKYCKIRSSHICFYFFSTVHMCVCARVNPCIYLFIYLRSFDILIRVYSFIRCQCVLWMICVAKRSGPHSRCSPNKLEYHISCWKCECAKKNYFAKMRLVVNEREQSEWEREREMKLSISFSHSLSYSFTLAQLLCMWEIHTKGKLIRARCEREQEKEQPESESRVAKQRAGERVHTRDVFETIQNK